MRISYNWLKEYVDIKLSPEKLADTLTMAGLSVESISRLGDDHILEIEITANRPDWLSYVGVAREVAALTGGKLKSPFIVKKKNKKEERKKINDKPITIRVVDRKLCPRYTGRVIRNVKVAESPAWLKARMEAMGLRSVNNIVDITNFCLFETGEPMHAFDLDKLSGGEIVVRKAVKGEKIVTIDGAQKELNDTDLIIADGTKPVAITGIMGGLNTEVSPNTKNILLEAAYFDPVAIRRSSRRLALSSDSSYRFERRVDPDNIVSSSDRALGLIMELAGGRGGEFIDIKSAQERPRAITLRYAKLEKVIGISIKPAQVKKILLSLGMKIRGSTRDLLKLERPGFRHDLKSEIDLIEEVARVFGYGKIPSTLPKIVEQPVRVENEFAIRKRMRDCLAGIGLDEIMTYSLLNKKALLSAGLSAEEAIDIKNPLTSEQETMRTSLIPGLLGAIAWNINRKEKDLKLFELGNVYKKAPAEEYREDIHLSVGIAGRAFVSWAGGSRETGFFELKGIAEALLAQLGIEKAAFRPYIYPVFSAAECAQILVGQEHIGVIGEVGRKTLDSFDIKEKVYLLELDASKLTRLARMEKRFEELPKYPSVFRDISIVVGKNTHNADVLRTVRDAAGVILKEVKLVDRYKGKQIPEDKLGLTYRLEYRDTARTLEEKDVTQIHSRILKELGEKLGAALR